MKTKKNLLILCTGNSCRSQMGEGIARHLFGDHFEVFSAGSKPSGSVNPIAVVVMEERGIDISKHYSKSVQIFQGIPMDLVITVCDNAKESCPMYVGSLKTLHWSFPDPVDAQGSTEEVIAVYRKVRDDIWETFQDRLTAWV